MLLLAGKIKSMAITKNSAAYWEGKSDAESLQRIYGISFPDNKLMKEWRHFQEEAAKRDHRKIGRVRERRFLQKRGTKIGYLTSIAFG